jgi:hypothetical protein
VFNVLLIAVTRTKRQAVPVVRQSTSRNILNIQPVIVSTSNNITAFPLMTNEPSTPPPSYDSTHHNSIVLPITTKEPSIPPPSYDSVVGWASTIYSRLPSAPLLHNMNEEDD